MTATTERTFTQKLRSRLQLIERPLRRGVRLLGGLYFTHVAKTYKVAGLELHVPFALTDLEFRGRFITGEYETEERRHLRTYLRPDATVLELGACLGVVSCLTNRLLDRPERHVVVEANPTLIPWIERNRDHNDCRFEIEQCLVTDRPAADFYLHELIVGGSATRATGKKISVPGKTIDRLEREHGLAFDTLVMDIEGGEYHLLRDYRDRLRRFRQIFMEIHPFSGILTAAQATECETALRAAGFALRLQDGYFQYWERTPGPPQTSPEPGGEASTTRTSAT